MNYGFLVETALLGQGLKSCDNETIREVWCKKLPADLRVLVWLWQGQIVIGNIDEFLEIRHTENMGRFSRNNLRKVMRNGESGFLTAAAAMEVAAELCEQYVVSCGIGGIIDGVVSSDLPALCGLPVVLFCTSPKDMIDPQTVLDYLHQRGLVIYGKGTDKINGYLFIGKDWQLDGCISKLSDVPMSCPLVLNPISEELRFIDRDILAKALLKGKEAVALGKAYHPAVNGALDGFTEGRSSYLQLVSLIDNVKYVYDETK